MARRRVASRVVVNQTVRRGSSHEPRATRPLRASHLTSRNSDAARRIDVPIPTESVNFAPKPGATQLFRAVLCAVRRRMSNYVEKADISLNAWNSTISCNRAEPDAGQLRAQRGLVARSSAVRGRPSKKGHTHGVHR